MKYDRIAVNVHGHSADLAQLVGRLLGGPVCHDAQVGTRQRLGRLLVSS